MSNKFKVTIDLGNDAMQTHEDVASALEELTAKLRSSGGTSGVLRDVNGNTVGRWGFHDEEDNAR